MATKFKICQGSYPHYNIINDGKTCKLILGRDTASLCETLCLRALVARIPFSIVDVRLQIDDFVECAIARARCALSNLKSTI